MLPQRESIPAPPGGSGAGSSLTLDFLWVRCGALHTLLTRYYAAVLNSMVFQESDSPLDKIQICRPLIHQPAM